MSLIATLALGLALSASPKADEKFYSVETAGTTAKLKVGADGKLKLHIKPAKGYKISREAPLKIKLAAAGVKLKKDALGQKDATDEKSEAPAFEVGFAALSAGDQGIEADASFFLCNETICEKKTEKLKVAVKVDP